MRKEKKFDAVFKMQFQATQVPPLEATGLMISLIPVGSGKPTARLERAEILEGTCTWENPVYETVELVKETKTGRIGEKCYYLIVSTVSSESGFLGHVQIDFADLAEATDPRNLTLPLQTSKSGGILHVTVQRVPEDHDARSTEDGEMLDAETRDRYSNINGSLQSTESEASMEATSSGDAESQNNQMKMLERKVEVSEKEVESLRQQVISESKKGQQLSEMIAHLQEERDAIKTECEQLKSDFASAIQKETESVKLLLEGIKKELQSERHLNDELKLQLQKTEDSNSEYILALRYLNKQMDQKNMETSEFSSKIKALESEKMDSDEEKLLKQTIENLNSEIEVHKKEREEILMDVKKLTADAENLERESKQICSTLQQNLQEKMEMEQNYSEALATVKQLEFRVETLEEDVKKQQLQYSETLTLKEELEIQVENLHKELENQAQLYEENLKTATEAKINQEQRAVRAKKAFREAMRDNTNMVERLQEEFKSLTDEMSLKIEENEKLAQKSTAEATELQQKNEVLESLLQKAEEEHQKTRTEYERYVHEFEEVKQLSDEMSLKIEENEKLAQKFIAETTDLRGKNKVLESLLQKAEEEHQITTTEYVRTVHELEELKQLSDEMSVQIEENEKLSQKSIAEATDLRLKNEVLKSLLQKAEEEHQITRTRYEGIVYELQEQNKRIYIDEREDLERQLASVREEVDKLKQENISIKSQVDLKNLKEVNLNLEVKKLRLKNSDLKNHLSQVELEKEDLKKEVATLQEVFHKNKENAQAKNINTSESERIGNMENNTSLANLRIVDDLRNQIELDSAQIKSLLGEVEYLTERNRIMEEGLEEMHERYSEISLRFAEVEGERQQLIMTLRNLKNGKKN
ncbi:uncharacterized protein LOC142532833 [Primulina tabacum]|uniref:uncharacterized protein LOC142532833 n=1 Tax=Primulina tabacum TaxID=48773 RepID=UPI003F5A98E8